MAAFPKLVLTSAGIALQTKVQGGATLELTNIQMGSGQLNGQPIGPLTALISSNATVPIQSGQAIGQNTYQVEGFFTNADLSAGFWWREIGIFANDPDNGEILYAYANAGDAGDYIPTVTDQRIEKYIYFSMTLANATTVTVTIPQTDTYVLQSTVGQANGVAGLGGNGAVPVAQGGTGATTAQGAVVALGALFAIAAAGAYNPEESYAVGDYCTYKGKLRKCSTAIPTGEAWTEAHWTTTTVAAELAELSSQLSNKVGNQSIFIPNNDCNDIADFGLYRVQNDTANGYNPTIGDLVINAPWDVNTMFQLYLSVATGRVLWRTKLNLLENPWSEWFPIANATPPDWVEMPLLGAYTAYDNPVDRLKFGKNGAGETCIYGMFITPNITSNDDHFAVLPINYRPKSRVWLIAQSRGTRESYPIYVETTGDIYVWQTKFNPNDTIIVPMQSFSVE